MMLFFAGNKMHAQNIFDNESSIKYAYYLFENERFENAAKEFERLVYILPQDDSLKLFLVKSYRKGKVFKQALLRSHELQITNNALINEWEKEGLKNLWQSGQAKKTDSALLVTKAQTFFEKEIATTLGLAYSYKWKDARNKSAENKFADSAKTILLHNILVQQKNEKYKSPGVALALSTVIPGLGKVYAGRWKDGIISLLFVGGMGIQAYRAFDQRGVKSTRGWIFATMGTGFYLGNLYGSYHAARIRNNKINEKYLLQINNSLDSLY
ncbi:MAG: TM2 domain-containing protein [Bacteroidetes bacterium]|nr:TM2 domain-containing protein [Bacteroidota bacterium]